MNRLSIVRLGAISYQEGLRQQAKFARIVKRAADQDSSRHFLLLLEHTPVYTVGIRSTSVSPEEESRLKGLGADFHRTSRGGLITFHGPGQLVAYPVVNLKRLRDDGGRGKILGARKYVELIEESIIRTAAGFGVAGVDRVAGLPGVWVEGTRKIASIGVSIQNGITGHGLAINSNTDLRWFSYIVACGIKDVDVTSLSREAGKEVSVEQTIPSLVDAFSDAFTLDSEEYIESDEDRSEESCDESREKIAVS